MEVRKIIAFGKSSFVVSLPKDWLEQHHLQKGDVLFLENQDNDLILRAQEKEDMKKEEKIFINTDGKTFNRIQREISSAYLEHVDYIVIQGKEVSKYANEIIACIQNLLALEVMEQSKDKIVAKDFLKIKDINLPDYFRKEDIIVRSMICDLADPEFKDYDELISRQRHLKRIYLLIIKVIRAVLKDSKQIGALNIPPEKLLSYSRYNFSLHNIGKALRSIARNLKEQKGKVEIHKAVKLLEQDYKELMKAIFNDDKEKAYVFSETRDNAIDETYALLGTKKDLTIIKERLAWIYAEMHEMTHRVYS